MRTPLALTALAGAALVLSGCTYASQETGAGSTAASSTGAGASIPAPFDVTGIEVDQAAAALLPDDIAASGVLRIGSETTYAPAEFLDVDGITAVGYDMDIARALAATLGLEAEITSASFDSIIPSVGTKFDAGVSSFTITGARLEVADMIQYLSVGEAYAVQAGNPQGIVFDDLCGSTVAVQTGTIQQEEIGVTSADCEAAGKEAITVLPFDSNADAATNVVGGKADVLFADSPIVGYAITQTGGRLEALGEAFATAPQGIVTAQGSDTTAALAAAMQAMMDNGTLKEILDAWGASAGMLTAATVNPAVS